jgi:hypothetical protein
MSRSTQRQPASGYAARGVMSWIRPVAGGCLFRWPTHSAVAAAIGGGPGVGSVRGRRVKARTIRAFRVGGPAMYDQAIAAGTAGLSGPSPVIESLENMGWRLDMMSWVPRHRFRQRGYFLFRCGGEWRPG